MHSYSDIDISPYLTMNIGGKVSELIEAESEIDLKHIIKNVISFERPVIVIGGGSNVIFRDGLINATIILNRFEGEIFIKDGYIHCQSSVSLKKFLLFCSSNSIKGFECLSGIPGTIGGALCGNAGAYGHYIGEFVEDMEVFDRRKKSFVTIKREQAEFDYRESIFKKTGNIIISARFNIPGRGYEKDILKEMKCIIEERKRKLPPMHTKCSGSFFKNVKVPGKERRVAAAYYIDKAGCKGMKVGDMKVSEKHANFIVNIGNGCFDDVIKLSEIVKKNVFEDSGIRLSEEVRFLP